MHDGFDLINGVAPAPVLPIGQIAFDEVDIDGALTGQSAQLGFLRRAGLSIVEPDQAGGSAVLGQMAQQLPPQITERPGDGNAACSFGHF
jgi:hypothetical protein